MRIEKWGFLLSYAIFLVFCMGFSLISKDNDAINTMILSITIASTAFSLSDLLFTKIDIDKKEKESLVGLYYLTDFARRFYASKIKVKYGKKAEEMLSMLMELFSGNEDEIEKFFEEKLSSDDKEKFLNKVKLYSNDELTEFVVSFIETNNSDINEIVNEDEELEDSKQNLLSKQEKKEVIYYVIASSIAVFGLIALLIVLTLRISVTSYVNSTLTIIAFFFVIINLILKDYYKANSVKTLEEEKKKLFKDLRENNEN